MERIGSLPPGIIETGCEFCLPEHWVRKNNSTIRAETPQIPASAYTGVGEDTYSTAHMD